MRAWPLSLTLCCFVVVGCSSVQERGELEPPPEIKNYTVGSWENVHKGDPNLEGFRVQQFPDCAYDAPRYEGRHPAMVVYLFKGNRIHQMSFAPDGKVEADFWDADVPDWVIAWVTSQQ
jgi:hypothetical protein